ncbi:MAG TPA: heparan-alpha-glucosaminide N-acetyltransferase domain-containing protein [Burkholderiaceae bacterium]
MPTLNEQQRGARYASVDSLRGLAVAAMLLVNDPGDWQHVYAPLEHAAWNGCTLADLVFPVFLFIVGVSITLASGAGRTTSGAVLLRAARIVGLGLALHLVAYLALDTASFRPMGVLQRIGICYAAAALLALRTSARTQWLVFVAILAGYGLLLAGAPMTKEANLASRFDTWLLGRHVYEFDAASGRGHDPEGLLSTLPALATTLLGVRCGAWLQRGARRTLLAAGLSALLLGWLIALVQPFNKQLWTPSYVLWTGGLAIAALLLAHELVDRRGGPAIARSLGVNAIAAYALAWLLVCLLEGAHWGAALYRAGFGWIVPGIGAEAASLAYAVVFVAIVWAVMVQLARRGIRIKV